MKQRTLVHALLASSALVLVLVATFVIAVRKGENPDKASAGPAASSQRRQVADPIDKPRLGEPPVGDPWPECAPIREWLAANLPEPDTLKDVSWVNTRPVTGGASITVQYRTKARQGGWASLRQTFVVAEGKAYPGSVFDAVTGSSLETLP